MANVAEDFGSGQPFPGLSLHQALKEWAIAIDALATGEQLVLLRKGGIQDPRQPFVEIPRAFVLFPTYEHQVPHHLKEPARLQGSLDAQATLPEAVISIQTWATLTHRVTLQSETAVLALLPFHIWNEAFLAERLKWRPHQPLTALVLRTYRLPEPVQLMRSPAYGGCRSWVPLTFPIPTQGSSPVLSDLAYQDRWTAIAESLEAVGARLEQVHVPRLN